MRDIKALLKSRKTIKARKPTFTRQDSHKKNEIKNNSYKRPRGLHSKMRENRRGYKIKISIGWRSPAEVRGMTPEGIWPILIHSTNDLAKIDTKTQGAVISHDVGARKKIEILKQSLGKIKILNVKDPEAEIKKISEMIAKRKELLKKRAEKKEQKKQEAPKSIEKKVEEAPKTKEEEKKEHDKILIQREV